jgi:hypothetical protein
LYNNTPCITQQDANDKNIKTRASKDTLDLAATLHNQFFCRSRESSVGISMAYELDDRVSIAGRIKRLFFIPRCPDWLWGPPNLLSNGYRWLFLQGLKRKEREADQSPSNAKVKNI